MTEQLIDAAETLRSTYNEIVEQVNVGTFIDCGPGAKAVLSRLRWAVGHLEVAREIAIRALAAAAGDGERAMSNEERMLITEIGGFDARLADRVAAVLVAHHTLGVHLQHCNAGEYRGGCKYGDADCPALADTWSWIGAARDREAAMRQFPPLSLDEIARVLHAFDVLPRGASRSDEATARAIARRFFSNDYPADALAAAIAAALAAARAEQAERDAAYMTEKSREAADLVEIQESADNAATYELLRDLFAFHAAAIRAAAAPAEPQPDGPVPLR